MARKQYDYYRHMSGGYAFDYFGNIGKAVQIGPLMYWFLRRTGYRVTRVYRGTALKWVYVRAALNDEVHRRSYKMKMILENGHDGMP